MSQCILFDAWVPGLPYQHHPGTSHRGALPQQSVADLGLHCCCLYQTSVRIRQPATYDRHFGYSSMGVSRAGAHKTYQRDTQRRLTVWLRERFSRVGVPVAWSAFEDRPMRCPHLCRALRAMLARNAACERAAFRHRQVRTIARMARMFKTLRQENETVLRLKGVCPGHRLQAGPSSGSPRLRRRAVQSKRTCVVGCPIPRSLGVSVVGWVKVAQVGPASHGVGRGGGSLLVPLAGHLRCTSQLEAMSVDCQREPIGGGSEHTWQG